MPELRLRGVWNLDPALFKTLAALTSISCFSLCDCKVRNDQRGENEFGHTPEQVQQHDMLQLLYRLTGEQQAMLLSTKTNLIAQVVSAVHDCSPYPAGLRNLELVSNSGGFKAGGVVDTLLPLTGLTHLRLGESFVDCRLSGGCDT